MGGGCHGTKNEKELHHESQGVIKEFGLILGVLGSHGGSEGRELHHEASIHRIKGAVG
jgi:hypothetical protein